MEEIWEASYREIQTSWGFEPSDSAVLARDIFLACGAREILIPGIGYGRNAKIFCTSGFHVTGIEISGTAIELAKSKNGLDIQIHHGSVMAMPFDNRMYDGIFCYALVHLLNARERKKFIGDCFRQIKPGGYMIFTVVSKKMAMHASGKQISKDRFEIKKGLTVFFYDEHSVKKEFGKYGLLEYEEMDEPVKHMENEPPINMILVKCKK